MATGDKIDSITVVVSVNTGTDQTPVWTAVGGQKSAKLSRKMKTEDATTKDDATAGYTKSMPGWKEWSVSCDGLKVESDTAFTALETAFSAKAAIKLQWTKGTAGVYTGSAYITSLDENSKEKGPVEVSVEFTGTGAITAVT